MALYEESSDACLMHVPSLHLRLFFFQSPTTLCVFLLAVPLSFCTLKNLVGALRWWDIIKAEKQCRRENEKMKTLISGLVQSSSLAGGHLSLRPASLPWQLQRPTEDGWPRAGAKEAALKDGLLWCRHSSITTSHPVDESAESRQAIEEDWIVGTAGQGLSGWHSHAYSFLVPAESISLNPEARRHALTLSVQLIQNIFSCKMLICLRL